MSKLVILNRSGDTTVQWEVIDLEAVKEAERIFKETREKGYSAFEVKPKNDIMIKIFNPLANEILMVPPLAGG